jgi:hypothetical protein
MIPLKALKASNVLAAVDAAATYGDGALSVVIALLETYPY